MKRKGSFLFSKETASLFLPRGAREEEAVSCGEKLSIFFFEAARQK